MGETMNTDIIVLVRDDDPERKPMLYACPKCGSVHSPKIYLAREDVQHATAREAAANCYNCRTHDTCRHCGCETPKGWLACSECRDAQRLEKAVEVADDGGPYFAFSGDEMIHEMEQAIDNGLEWVCPTKEVPPTLDADDIIDGLLSDMHEDADVDDLNGVDAFFAAVKAFNEAQTTRTYWADETRKIRVPAPAGGKDHG